MILKKIKLFGLLVIVAAATILGCKDDFTEGDFLKLQSDLAIKADTARLLAQFKAQGAETEAQAQSYIDALNQAGDLLGVSILVREDNRPIEGVSVAINTVATPVVTDASGIAYFDRVRIGEATVTLSKANYASASALVTFGTPTAPVQQTVSANGVTTTRWVAPQKRFENVGLPLFAVGGTGSTATIRGRVTYERDLTNQVPEIPRILPAGGGAATPITIQVNLRTALASQIVISSSTGGNAEVLTYQIADGAFGSSTVDLATGNYSMLVPASVGGIGSYSLIIPEITDNQTLAINGAPDASGAAVALPNGPELRTDVPTKWSASYTQDASPSVPSAFMYFPEPPAAGRGFAPTFSAISRPIDLGTYGDVTNSNQELVVNTMIRFNNRGQGYTAAPTVTFSNPTSGITSAVASLRGYVTGVNISNGGNGYPATVFIQFTQISAGGAVTPLAGVATIPVGSAGTLPTGPVTLPATSGYVGNSTQFVTDANISALGVRLVDGVGTPILNTSATITPTFTTEINGIQITTAGTYNSAPTITLTGGNPTTAATVVVQEYRVQWEMNFPNSAPTTPYRVLPADFTLLFPPNGTSSFTSNKLVDVVGANGNVVVTGTNIAPAVNLVDLLSTDGTTIIKRQEFSSLTYRTQSFWNVAPQLSIIDRPRARATGSLVIDNSAGRVAAVNIISIGAGYDAATLTDAVTGVAIRPAFVGAPGSGATFTVNFSSINAVTREASMVGVGNGAITLGNNGTGYRTSVNTTAVGPTQDAFPTVRTGQIYNVDIRLGTGDRPAGYN